MRKLEIALVLAVLAVGIWRVASWYDDAYAAQQSLLAMKSVVPEKRPEGDYVSSRECSACHPEAYRAWHASYHRTMTQLATPEAVLGDFDDVTLAWAAPPTHHGGSLRLERYRFSRRDGEYWATLLGSAPGVADQESRVVMTTGSHHFQVYWVSSGRNRELMNLPFTYLIQEGRWIPRREAFLAPPYDSYGALYWSDGCIQCHSTQGQPRVAAGKPADSRVADLGIACESCHGPAGPHVAANKSPLRRYMIHGQEDATIVNPERLSAARAVDVCGRCHGVSGHQDGNTWEGHWNGFLPGEKLESNGWVVLRPERRDPLQQRLTRAMGQNYPRDRFWSDGEVRVAGREMNDILNSPCFKGEEFSCLSCHSLHGYESPADQLAEGMDGDAACTQCHAQDQYLADLSTHTRHAAESDGSRCQNCHMPYTTYGLLKAIRSHRVTSPDLAAELETGRPNACNACHLDRSLAWTQDQLERDYGMTRIALDETAQSVAAGPRWVAIGDAGVRALAAFYMGWKPAQQAAGSGWMAPYLAELLDDPYAAVRSIAWGSLRGYSESDDLKYDFVRPPGTAGTRERREVQARWESQSELSLARAPGPLLTRERGYDREAWEHLKEARDDRPIALVE